MATFALTDATTWFHGFDMTTDLNEISISAEVEDQETTTFGSGGYRSRIGGLKSVSADLSGLWQSDTTAIDPTVFTNLATADRVVTMANDDAEASTAYMFRAGLFSYDLFGSIGEVTPFSLSAMGTDGQGLIRGQVAKAKGNVSSTGAIGSVVNLGAVSASQYLYAAFHVFSAGTTITVDIESDDAANFPSATSRITLGPLTTTGGTWATRLAGAITDTHYRFNITAITGTFSVAGAIGIGS